MARRKYKVDDTWKLWSYTKLKLLYTCPFRFWNQYVMRIKKPQPPIYIVGSALHYMAYHFYKRTFKSAESFCNAWTFHWLKVIKGESGPARLGSDPLDVAWEHEKQPYYWLHEGKKILAGFYDRHIERRNRAKREGLAIVPEKRFERVYWNGLQLGGVIDRIDEAPDHVEITDYKMGSLPLPLLETSLQPIFYVIGFDTVMRNTKFHGKPIRAINFENFFTGKVISVSVPDEETLGRFYEFVREATEYTRAILTGKQTLPFVYATFQYLRPQDMQEGIFRPNLPRADHCRYCLFMQECIDWEKNHIPASMRRAWIDLLIEQERKRMPEQRELDFG